MAVCEYGTCENKATKRITAEKAGITEPLHVCDEHAEKMGKFFDSNHIEYEAKTL